MGKKKQKKENILTRVKPATIISIIAMLEVFIYFIASKDSGSLPALRWLIVIGLIAVLLRPYLSLNSLKIWDNGFGLSFALGFGLSFLIAWLLSVCKIFKFDTPICIVSVLVLAIIVYLIPAVRKFSRYKWDMDKIEQYIWGFALFALFFQFTFWVIGFNGFLDNGTENYMDFGFMQAIYRQKMVAPYDMWFAGEKLNYYYLGQAAAVFLCRLAFTIPEYGYNFMLATFWSLVFVGSGELVYGVVMAICKQNKGYEKQGFIVSLFAGFVASIYNAFAANGHWLLYGILSKIFNVGSNTPGGDYVYWFPDATVYINVAAGDPDNGKNEFPAYSAILGDLHAHVINVIFVLALIGLILDYIFIDKKKNKRSYVNLVLAGLLLGIFKGSNYWDFVMYYVIFSAGVVCCDFTTYGFKLKTFIGVVIKAAIVTVISFVVTLPFTLTFKKMASEVLLANHHSPISKLIILWGIPIVITIAFLVWMMFGKKFISINSRSKSGLLAFGLCTVGLIITPEVLYIKDIYEETDARFNTMFKLTYQAFILFGIIIGITVGLLIFNGIIKKKEVKKFSLGYFGAGVIVFITILLALYTKHALKDWMGDITNPDEREGISTLEPLYSDGNYFKEMQVVDIIMQDEKEVVNIVEAAGDSYTHQSAISVMTGACTVQGWFVHEWMWRDSLELASQRDSEIRMFYESGDESYCQSFIDKYNIDYIFVGPVENEKYTINREGFEKLGTPIWVDNDEIVGDSILIRTNKNQ